MILVYTPKINNRIQYIAKTLLNDICGFDYKVTHSGEDFLNFKGARINYSDKDMPVSCIKIYPSGFLLEKGIHEFVPDVEFKDNFPMLFPFKQEDGNCDLGYDLFASAFYMLSRYEEYLPFLEDRHGRFEADQSLAYQKGFLDLPVVDMAAMALKSQLLELFPYLESKKRKYSFLPTYDIDIAYAYKGKGIARNVFIVFRDLITLNFQILAERFYVMWDLKQDPFDTYDFQLQLQKQYNLDPVYFFLCASFGPKDRGVSIHSRVFSRLVKTIGDYARAGIHPSYASHSKEKRLKYEIEFLSGVLNRNIEYSRQHYLKFKLPVTYQNLLKANIKSDYSMGYASHTGFRAGTCSPFSFYDLSLESETKLRVYPITIMDGTLRDYMKLKPEDALAKVKDLIDIIKQVDGLFVSLWHNDALGNQGNWKGWRDIYLEIVKYAK